VKFHAPGEDAAADRAWEVVRAAYTQREPVTWPRKHARPLLAGAVVVAAVAAILSPPGRSVVHSLRKAVGVQNAQTELFSLPSPGRLLVSGRGGTWIVNQDGSRRRLGPYRDAAWSPHGLFVVATTKNELAALDPKGNVRWTLPRRSPRFPAWTGSRTDTRIAYISGRELRIVAGDGTGDHAVAKAAATFRPTWLPGRKVLFSTGSEHVIYDDRSGAVRPLGSFQHVFDPAVGRKAGQSEVVYHGKIVFRGTGVFGQAVPSPNGRWLLVTWPTADQWVFVRPGSRKIVGVSRISSQFGGFPHVEGWCCAP
jgi:hypothetical protein